MNFDTYSIEESRFRMQNCNLGKTLFIINPAAHSGKGKEHARVIEDYLTSHPQLLPEYTIHLTSGPKEAIEVASHANKFNSVIALGGDGIIHEVVNGLMQIEPQDRPTLGIIPVGSGNDYARTLKMAINNPICALKEVLMGHKRRIDVGVLTTEVEKRYFMQTLSFGIDAAIAHDTTDRRAEGAHTTGESLFVTSGLKLFSKVRKGWPCRATFDGESVEFPDVVFAVHIGPTYGGGFTICPHANPADGKLSICHSLFIPKLTITTLAMFMMVKLGRHARFKCLTMRKANEVKVEFLEDVAPVQVDGEKVQGTRFNVSVDPLALEVYTTDKITW